MMKSKEEFCLLVMNEAEDIKDAMYLGYVFGYKTGATDEYYNWMPRDTEDKELS